MVIVSSMPLLLLPALAAPPVPCTTTVQATRRPASLPALQPLIARQLARRRGKLLEGRAGADGIPLPENSKGVREVFIGGNKDDNLSQDEGKVWVEADYAAGKIFGDMYDPMHCFLLLIPVVLDSFKRLGGEDDTSRSAESSVFLALKLLEAFGLVAVGGGGGGPKTSSMGAAAMKPDFGLLDFPRQGKWSKIEAYDQDEAMRKLGLSAVFRQGANLLSNIVINASKSSPKVERFSASVLIRAKGCLLSVITIVTTVISIVVDIRLSTPRIMRCCLPVVEHNRRDRRPGPHRGRLKTVKTDSAAIEVSWGEPHGGYLLETFRLKPSDPNILEVVSDIRLDDDAVTKEKSPGQSQFGMYGVQDFFDTAWNIGAPARKNSFQP
eukprot:jgi/Bigna1/67411/fgenesh1_pg.3_\